MTNIYIFVKTFRLNALKPSFIIERIGTINNDDVISDGYNGSWRRSTIAIASN